MDQPHCQSYQYTMLQM
uniref:Uncharacterized protein n=1 Tax=Rhizophora mucronata TaxID=61149 RepID=A0A2P2MXK9_RHIMU